MKKSIFIFAAFFAATFANAQITLEYTYNTSYFFLPNIGEGADIYTYCYGDVYCLYEKDVPSCIEDCSGHYTVIDAYNHEELGRFELTEPFIAARNLFTTDNSLVVLTKKDGDLVLMAVDKTIVQNLGAKSVTQPNIKIFLLPDGSYKMILRIHQEGWKTEVYSLPGKGVPTEITSPAPQRSSSRKIVRDGQVFVETENNTYTLQGQEVK